jgi:hypothetical protein
LWDYYDGPGVFRDLQRACAMLDEATATTATLNAARHRQGLKILDTCSI